MRVMMAGLLSMVVLCVVGAGPVAAEGPDVAVQSMHYGLSGIVTKIQAGILFIKIPHGLQPRSISPNKADRVGLHNAKIGDPVLLLLDSGNVLLDAGTPTRADLFEHRLIAGRMGYSDPYWSEILLSTPEGSERFEVDTLAASKLSVFPQGARVIIELDADNMLIDIHPGR
ncbi:MAG TPA: hypothetical protein VJ805_01370 [Nitrospiraceae bacterium]|nr:hypothetical protein [Nitrospiraceae bacterium]